MSKTNAPLTAAQIVEQLREWVEGFVRGNEAADPPLEGKAIEVYESLLAFSRATLSTWEALEGLVSVDGVEGQDAVRVTKARADMTALLGGE